MASSIQTYKKRAGTNADLGLKFERDIMCLIYMRCVKLYKMNKLKSFKIANNVDHVGSFDDIVCRIEYEENGSLKTSLIFIQAKHKEEPEKNAFSDETLMATGKNKKNKKVPPILEYIKSFFQIRKILDGSEHSFKTSDKNISVCEMKKIEESLRQAFDCKLEDAQFVYYTNATTKELEYFCQKQDSGMVKNILGTSFSTEIYKSKLNHIQLIDKYPDTLKNLSPNEVESLKQFLDSFSLYLSQGSERGLESIIIKEMGSIDNIKFIDLNALYKTLCDEMAQSSKVKDSHFITEQNNYDEKIFSFLQLHFHTSTIKWKFSRWSKLYSAETIEKLHKDVLNRKIISIQYEKLMKPNFVVQCLQLAEYMNDRNNDFCFLFVRKDSFEMWREVRNLYNYSVHSKVLVCIDNVLIEDVRKVCSTEVGTQEMIVIISENYHVNRRFLWTQLSSTGIEQFMNSYVTFQNVSVKLKEVFGNIDLQQILVNTNYQRVLDTLISDVIKNEVNNIGSSLPVEEKIYIKRRYEANTTFLKFEALNEDQDTFILYPKCNVPSSLNVDNFKNIRVFENEEEARFIFSSCPKRNQGTHLCFVKNSLMILRSQGTVTNVVKYEINNYIMNEDEFIQNFMNIRCTVISDNVGMGKSTALKRLAHCLKTRCKYTWVEYINLNLLDNKLQAIKETTTPICALTQLLNLDDMGRMIFKHKCFTDGKVALLFDGFDEISPESRENFQHLVQALSQTKINTIVVSTRPNVETELSNTFFSIHYNIIGFSYDDMYSYLLKYCSQNIDNECTKKLPKIVEDIVNQAKVMKEILHDIVAVPLQTKMLAETCNEKIMEILSSEEGLPSLELPKLSLYSLYNNFINIHIDRCMIEKFNTTDDNTSNYVLAKDVYFKRNSGIWEAIACKEMFPSIDICDFKAFDMDDLVKQRIGIFVHKDPETVIFIHRSFAEFLAAKHVTRLLFESKNIERLNFIYQNILIDNTFIVLRKFTNAIYDNERFWETAEINFVPGLKVDAKVLMVAVKENNAFIFKVILHHLSENKSILKQIINHKDKYGLSLLHVSAQICEQVFDDILNSDYFHCAKDVDASGRTAFCVACCYGRENAVKSFLNIFKNTSLLAIIDDTSMWGAAESGYTNIVKILHEHGASIHSKTNERSLLFHVASLFHTDTIKYLIEQGADVNEINRERSLLMHVLGDNHSTGDIVGCVKYLVEKAGVNVKFQNKMGYTALIIASIVHNNFEIVKCLTQHGADIKAVDSFGMNAAMYASRKGDIETVKYLIEIGADVVNEVNAQGVTCFAFSAFAENSSLLQYFIEECKPKLDFQDNLGYTALFWAVSNVRFENVKLLITHGASVNICNNEGGTALSTVEYKLHKNGFKEIINYLVENGANINHQDHLGNSLLHSLHLSTSRTTPVKYNLIVWLVKLGADINLKNKEGITPAMMAQNY